LRSSRAPLWFALVTLVFAGECFADAVHKEKSLDFVLPALREDAPIRLTAYRDKIVYVDVWASWCTPCLRSMPELETLREKFRGQPFEVVAVNVDSDARAARAFLDRVNVHYLIAFDRDGAQLHAQLPGEPGLAALPVGFLLDGHGTIRLIHRGYSSGQSAFLAENIQTLLAELRVESHPGH
jgi:cytochrome c biogenesis protein CcmG, thiol:disulfide interchange protein DsbE